VRFNNERAVDWLLFLASVYRVEVAMLKPTAINILAAIILTCCWLGVAVEYYWSKARKL